MLVKVVRNLYINNIKYKIMIKKFFCLLWTCSLQDTWTYLWSKTEVDEKVIAVVKKTKSKAKAVKKTVKGKK
jgi:hypothetical protein|tara:strand:+ start:18345 stop:18560 length:216 start_codon:yes stop_codon:yes gene_type:complete